jgi:hypothetical protein
MRRRKRKRRKIAKRMLIVSNPVLSLWKASRTLHLDLRKMGGSICVASGKCGKHS